MEDSNKLFNFYNMVTAGNHVNKFLGEENEDITTWVRDVMLIAKISG